MSNRVVERSNKFSKFYAELPESLDIHTSITDRIGQLQHEFLASKAMGEAQRDATSKLYNTCNEQLQGIKTQQNMSPLNFVHKIIKDPNPDSEDLIDKLKFVLLSLDFVFATSMNLAEKLNSVDQTITRCTTSLSYLDDLDLNFPSVSLEAVVDELSDLKVETITPKSNKEPQEIPSANRPITPPMSPINPAKNKSLHQNTASKKTSKTKRN